ISGCAMRTSARRSRPITTSLPGAKVRVEPSYRTVSAGGAGRLIGPNSIGTFAGWGGGPWSASRRRLDAPSRGVGDLSQPCDPVTARGDDMGERGVDGRPPVAGRAPVPAEYHHPLIVDVQIVVRVDMHVVNGRDAGPHADDHVGRAVVLTSDAVRHACA